MSCHDLPNEVEEAAKVCAGNHRKFESFGWHDAPDDDENWMIVNTGSRDSGLIEESNEHMMLKELEPFTEGEDPDVHTECHGHWAVGHVNALVIRVYKEAETEEKIITEAFKAWHKMAMELSDYPLLDESDHSQREYDAQHEAIENAAPLEHDDFERSEDWCNQVWKWFWDNEQGCSLFQYDESSGPYINEEDVARAMKSIGIRYDGDDEDEA